MLSFIRTLSRKLTSNERTNLSTHAQQCAANSRFLSADFERREPFRTNYIKIADVLTAQLDFSSVLDLGCGNGFLLEPMADRGKDVLGVELSGDAHALLRADLRDRVVITDVTEFAVAKRFDLVACIEVAEHIESSLSDKLIATITNHAAKWVYFTAASPYQPGHGHINCHQQFFWLKRFRNHGFHLDWRQTETLIESIHDLTPATWLIENSLILRREDVPQSPR